MSLPKRTPQEPTENRQNPRRKALKAGRIIFNIDRSSLDVQITDLSATGAKLKMQIPMPCPARFNLEVLQPPAGSPSIRRCKIRWQRGATCGVEFF